MAIQATFANMGVRTKKSIAHHLLVENAYESNLLSDISRVDYLANHKGRTHLRPLDELPVFVDDVYVFGYLRQKDIVYTKGKVLCTVGDNGSARDILSRIVLAARAAMGKKLDDSTRRIPTNILHTIALREHCMGSAIRTTVARIEHNTNSAAKTNWMELYGGEEPAGLFVAKVDVSEIPMEELQAALPVFDRHLLPNGYGLYSIDYTQDFSGVLDRKTLVQYLCNEIGFREHGGLFDAMCDEDQSTILDNTSSVGNHVCTWVQSTPGGTTRTKIYNKIVSNFEAGEIQAPVGGHLSEYVDCPNEHLRKTFQHPDVQERGCTRIEVSLYGCIGDQLSTATAKNAVDKVLELVSPDEGLFVVQPPAQQWKNLAACLDRCLVLANRPQGEVFVAWYAHTRTGRVAGMRIAPTQTTIEDDKKWERAVFWAMGDFGFRVCPIFRIDILSIEPENIEIAPLRCYTKDQDSQTILAASKKPTQLHSDAPDPALLLPETPYVSWVWRKKKTHSIGVEQSEFEPQEVDTDRKISTLSKAGREARLQEIEEALLAYEWQQQTHGWQQQIVELREAQIHREEEQRQKRKTELEKMRRLVEIQKRHKTMQSRRRKEVLAALQKTTTRKVSDIAHSKTWSGQILGYRRPTPCSRDDKIQDNDASEQTNPRFHNAKTSGVRVVLAPRGTEADTDAICVWTTKALSRILEECIDDFQKETDKYKREIYWIPAYEKYILHIDILPTKTFLPQGREDGIQWNPIAIVATPPTGERAAIQGIVDEVEGAHEQMVALELEETRDTMLRLPNPPTKNCTRSDDMPEGEYGCRRYSHTEYRGTPRTILYLYPIDADGEATSEIETPVFGWFLQAEIEKYGGGKALANTFAPICCKLGTNRTTPQKKKSRLATIAMVPCTTTVET